LLLLALFVLVLAVGAFLYLKKPPPPPPQYTPEEVKGFFQKHTCTNCHDIKNPLVGPPFQAIAERYKDDPKAEEKLFKSVREGSRGKWYDPNSHTIYGIQKVMPPRGPDRVPDDHLRAMIRWILDLAKDDRR